MRSKWRRLPVTRGRAVGQADRGDQEVGVWEALSLALEVGLRITEDAGSFGIQCEHADGTQVNSNPVTLNNRIASLRRAVVELRGGDSGGGERVVGLALASAGTDIAAQDLHSCVRVQHSHSWTSRPYVRAA